MVSRFALLQIHWSWLNIVIAIESESISHRTNATEIDEAYRTRSLSLHGEHTGYAGADKYGDNPKLMRRRIHAMDMDGPGVDSDEKKWNSMPRRSSAMEIDQAGRTNLVAPIVDHAINEGEDTQDQKSKLIRHRTHAMEIDKTDHFQSRRRRFIGMFMSPRRRHRRVFEATTYKNFRFTTTKTRYATNSVQIAEIEFGVNGQAVSLTGAVASNPGGPNKKNEEPRKAIDGRVSTKWIDFNIGRPLYVTLYHSIYVDSFRFITANDHIGRDPVQWRCDAQLLNGAWVSLHRQSTDFATPKARFTETTWFPQAHQVFTCASGSGTRCATCVPQAQRTSNNHCATCNAGYHTPTTSGCTAYSCVTKKTKKRSGCATCVPQAQRTSNRHCATCKVGYHTPTASGCTAYWCGKERSGCATCVPQAQRISNTHCRTCRAGYHTPTASGCTAYSCAKKSSGTSCATCVPQAQRTSNTHCATCNAGYHTPTRSGCTAYSCVTGIGTSCATCVPQAQRASNTHCATCNAGYHTPTTSGCQDNDCSRVDIPQCLERAWSSPKGATCATSRRWCEDYSKDMHRCCSQTCDVDRPCNYSSCMSLKGAGDCMSLPGAPSLPGHLSKAR